MQETWPLSSCDPGDGIAHGDGFAPSLVALLQGVGDLPGIRQPHALNRLRPGAGLTERIAVEVVDDADAGVRASIWASLGFTLDSAKIAFTFSRRMVWSSSAVSPAEGSACVETLGMTAPTTLRPKALGEVAQRIVIRHELRTSGGISLMIACTCGAGLVQPLL